MSSEQAKEFKKHWKMVCELDPKTPVHKHFKAWLDNNFRIESITEDAFKARCKEEGPLYFQNFIRTELHYILICFSALSEVDQMACKKTLIACLQEFFLVIAPDRNLAPILEAALTLACLTSEPLPEDFYFLRI